MRQSALLNIGELIVRSRHVAEPGNYWMNNHTMSVITARRHKSSMRKKKGQKEKEEKKAGQ
jgi:hypothetical protein